MAATRTARARAEAGAFAGGLSAEDHERVGSHVVRGPVAVGAILERFVAGHLEEHAEALERLAQAG